jgi:hypothetical protein
MDVRNVPVQGSLRKRHSLYRLKERPAIYILILLCVCVAAGLCKTRADSIFACQARGYTSDKYLAYCGAEGYGDYEPGAFWFGLAPRADIAAPSVDVLFVGDSRLLLALQCCSCVR